VFVTENKKEKQIIKIFIYLLILLKYKVYIYTFLLLAGCLVALLAGESDESKQTDRKKANRQAAAAVSSNCWGSFGLPFFPSFRARSQNKINGSYFFKPNFL
jgi:hypothetical protein